MPTKSNCDKLLEIIGNDPDKEEMEYMTKEVVLKKIAGLKEGTLNDYIRDCKDNFSVEHTILNPSHKVCLIHYKQFKQYLQWRSDNQLKARKEKVS